jgi:hypothetical protein
MLGQSRSATFNREVDMYPPLLALFVKTGIAFAEVPFYGKRIDLLFGSPSLRSLYSVESKLHDWRGAFKQAALNQLAAQRSYIAVPSKLAFRLVEREIEMFQKYDIGLISVDYSARILVAPKKNSCFSVEYYRELRNTLKVSELKIPNRIGVVADAIADRKKAMVVLQTRAY